MTQPAMQTLFGILRAITPDLPQPQRSVTQSIPVGSTAEFWGNMIKGIAPTQMMKKGLGEALWREKEKLARAWLEEALPKLKGALTSDTWLGGRGEMMTAKNRGLSSIIRSDKGQTGSFSRKTLQPF